MGTEPGQAGWPAHLPAGALRVVRWSARYEETVAFYRDAIGLPVLETFRESYGLDGTILGLPGLPGSPGDRPGRAGIVPGRRAGPAGVLPARCCRPGADPGQARRRGCRPVAQIDYWQANGGVTYQDPDGREVVFASWIYLPARIVISAWAQAV